MSIKLLVLALVGMGTLVALGALVALGLWVIRKAGGD